MGTGNFLAENSALHGLFPPLFQRNSEKFPQPPNQFGTCGEDLF